MTFDANIVIGFQFGLIAGVLIGAFVGGALTFIWVRES